MKEHMIMGRCWCDSKSVIGQEDNYATSCLLDYVCFKNYYKMMAMNLNKRQVLQNDSKNHTEIQYYWKARSSRTNENFHYWGSTKSCYKFFTGNCENITILFHFNILPIYNDSV